MPADEDIDAAVEADSASAAEDGREAVASSIPEAEEPLKASVVNSLGQLLGPAIKRLTGGQLNPPKWTPVEEDLAALPVELAGPILALGGMTQEQMDSIPELEEYAFDGPALIVTNDGLTEVGSIIDSMSRDKALVAALSAKGTEPEDDEVDPDADTDTDTDTDFEPEEPAEE